MKEGKFYWHVEAESGKFCPGSALPKRSAPIVIMGSMARVKVLPEVLAHKIAAGEIVERPASVVKELLENALDACAGRIVVRAEGGGTRLISVADDGVGMSPEDARLAFEHHATSKISCFEDLHRIITLGFRGEALPSIASVSRLRLRTAEQAPVGQTPMGTEIQYDGGDFKGVREISRPAGTEVMVEDLFFNVPARRKFLKTQSTELSHLSRQVIYYALAYPQTEFRLYHGERPGFEATAVSRLEERAYQLLGEAFLQNLVPIEYEKEGVRISGLTSLPHEQRSSAASQFLYVNRRMVRDRVLTHALHLAYRDVIPSGVHPVVLLFVEIDPAEIDVNVHPCKIEIRFRDSNRVHSAIYHAIQEALLRRKANGLASSARDIPLHSLPEPIVRDQPAWAFGNGPWVRPRLPWGTPCLQGEALNSTGDPPGTPSRPGTWDPGLGNPAPGLRSQVSRPEAHRGDIPETAHLSVVPVVLGQFVESFIVAVDRESVLVVDQHVAHERILYERGLAELESSQGLGCPRQQLLVPLTLELNAPQRLALQEILEGLNANGFEVEWFGSSTLAVKAVPSIASECNVERLLEEILQSLDSQERRIDLRRLREKIAISVSCRSAIKINTPLSAEKMQWLLDALFQCANPYTCPHGRPIILRLGIEEILRGFKRI